MTYVNHIHLTVSNAHNLLTKRLYEYIHRATKRIGESEVSVFCLREGQFICTDDTLLKVYAAWQLRLALPEFLQAAEEWLNPCPVIILRLLSEQCLLLFPPLFTFSPLYLHYAHVTED